MNDLSLHPPLPSLSVTDLQMDIDGWMDGKEREGEVEKKKGGEERTGRGRQERRGGCKEKQTESRRQEKGRERRGKARRKEKRKEEICCVIHGIRIWITSREIPVYTNALKI